MTKAICEFCHRRYKPVGGVTACARCYHQGLLHEPLYPVLLRDLREVVRPVGGRVAFTYVGDDQFALEVRGMGGYPIIVGTIAADAGKGRWWTYPAVPEPGHPWAVAFFRHRLQWPFQPEARKLPVTDEEFVAFVTEHRDALDAFAPGDHCRICGCEPCRFECLAATKEA